MHKNMQPSVSLATLCTLPSDITENTNNYRSPTLVQFIDSGAKLFNFKKVDSVQCALFGTLDSIAVPLYVNRGMAMLSMVP